MAKKNRNLPQQINNDDKVIGNDQGISKKSKIRYILIQNENYEQQIAVLLKSLSTYNKRNGKLRDSGDLLAESLTNISTTQLLSPTMAKTTNELSKIVRLIQDHRDSEILYLEDKLFPFIAEYGETLQKQREEIRSNYNKMSKESNPKLNWIRQSSTTNLTMNQQQQIQSNRRLHRGTNKLRSKNEQRSLEKCIQSYEMMKMKGFKKFILKLILTELRFTMRSFNNLTYIYKYALDMMKPSSDLRYFNDFFKFSPKMNDHIDSIDSDDDDTDEDDRIDHNTDEEDADGEDVEDDDNNQPKDKGTKIVNKSNSISDRNDGNTTKLLKRFNSTPDILMVKGDSKIRNKSIKSRPSLQSSNRTSLKLTEKNDIHKVKQSKNVKKNVSNDSDTTTTDSDDNTYDDKHTETSDSDSDDESSSQDGDKLTTGINTKERRKKFFK